MLINPGHNQYTYVNKVAEIKFDFKLWSSTILYWRCHGQRKPTLTAEKRKQTMVSQWKFDVLLTLPTTPASYVSWLPDSITILHCFHSCSSLTWLISHGRPYLESKHMLLQGFCQNDLLQQSPCSCQIWKKKRNPDWDWRLYFSFTSSWLTVTMPGSCNTFAMLCPDLLLPTGHCRSTYNTWQT